MRKGLEEHYPPLTAQEAAVESNRCLYCYDAPCTHACPTHIDVPRFIKKIATGNLAGSARAIFDSNLLGATCSRVCPVQELCEGACVLRAENNPIAIGRLQRYAMDNADGRAADLIRRAPPTGRSVAVVGAGPAGLSCAGELARRGHAVTVIEKRDLAGGLSTYGIIAIREPVQTSLDEVRLIESLGVKIETGKSFGTDIHLADLQSAYDAVFLAVGLGATPEMGIPGEDLVLDGLEYIERSKLNPTSMTIGREVAIIGAGNTAIDCATIARRLGAGSVTIIYRRSENEMTAYPHEYAFAKNEGISFQFLTQPVAVLSRGAEVTGLQCLPMALGDPDASGRRTAEPLAGREFVLNADQVVKAIGQKKPALAQALGLETDLGFLKVDDNLKTSIDGVYAGGDCIRVRGSASTVMAVQDGKRAASAIHVRIMAEKEAN